LHANRISTGLLGGDIRRLKGVSGELDDVGINPDLDRRAVAWPRGAGTSAAKARRLDLLAAVRSIPRAR